MTNRCWNAVKTMKVLARFLTVNTHEPRGPKTSSLIAPPARERWRQLEPRTASTVMSVPCWCQNGRFQNEALPTQPTVIGNRHALRVNDGLHLLPVAHLLRGPHELLLPAVARCPERSETEVLAIGTASQATSRSGPKNESEVCPRAAMNDSTKQVASGQGVATKLFATQNTNHNGTWH